MSNDNVTEAELRALDLLDRISVIRDEVGYLDDLYETEYIDNRLLSEQGAFQHITHALRQIQSYVWQIKEDRRDG
jgi:hypothetical protein